MKTLPINTSIENIKEVIVEWNELLAEEKYAEALSMFLYDMREQWTPELLEQAVYGYGCVGFTREEAEREFGSSDYKVTSIHTNPNKDKIINSIDVDYSVHFQDESYIGMVHYDNVPLNEKMSDLTARFYIKKLDNMVMTLEFLDLHVM